MHDIGGLSNVEPVSPAEGSPPSLSGRAPATARAVDSRPVTRLRAALWGAGGTGLALAIALLLRTGIPEILRRREIAGWRLLWLLPIHLVPLAPDAAGWRRLLRGTHAPGLAYMTWASTVHEAVNGLLPAAQVGGE